MLKKVTAKAIVTFLVALFTFSLAWGQDTQAEKFQQLYSEKKYEEIIRYIPKSNEELSAKALYYKGMSYYMKSDDSNAMKYLDLAISKGPVDHDMFFYKGMLLYYGSKFNDALPYFDKAIAMRPNEPDFYGGKGEVYYSMDNKDSAIKYFEKAAALPGCKARVFILAAEMNQELGMTEKALTFYKTALEKLTPADESYQNCSFNIGLMQQLLGKATEAKATLENHVSAYPDDYHAIAKLIQAYYSLSEFDNALPYKAKLYQAHKAKKLEAEMKEMFCFDQFIWDGKRIMAFELFDEPEGFMFVKHRFYVLDDKGKVLYQVNSESDAAIRMKGPKSKYVLCLEKNGAHYTYWNYIFNDEYKYPELKGVLLDILNKKMEPGSAVIPGTKK